MLDLYKQWQSWYVTWVSRRLLNLTMFQVDQSRLDSTFSLSKLRAAPAPPNGPILVNGIISCPVDKTSFISPTSDANLSPILWKIFSRSLQTSFLLSMLTAQPFITLIHVFMMFCQSLVIGVSPTTLISMQFILHILLEIFVCSNSFTDI